MDDTMLICDLDDDYQPSTMPAWQEPLMRASDKLLDDEEAFAQLQSDLARAGDLP
jgi:hypothetical protein